MITHGPPRGAESISRERQADPVLGEQQGAPPPPPSRTKWTRPVHPSVLIGHVYQALDVAPLEPHAEHEASGGGGTPRKRMGSPGAPRRRSGSPAAATHRVKRLAKLANEEEGDGVVPARTNEPVLSEEDERRLKPGKSETEILSTTKRCAMPRFCTCMRQRPRAR